jgi:signal transduction histidine kinase
MKPLPIRWKITLWSAATTSGALLIFATGTIINLYRDQIATADLEMTAEAGHLMQAPPAETHYGPWLQHIATEDPLMACSIFPANPRFIKSLPATPDIFAHRALGIRQPQNLRRADGSWRVCTYLVNHREILIAYDLFDVSDRIADLMAACLLALPLGTAFTAFGAWIVAGRALAPVRAATETAAAIEAGAIDLRLPPAIVNDEIGRLTTMLNQMLDRLEKNFRQADRFAADASHELRTPLTIMRGEIDALLGRTDLAPEIETKLLSLQEEIARINRITEHLLLLARFDAGKAVAGHTRVNLSALVGEALEDAELFAASQSIRIEAEIFPDIAINGDPVQLRRVLLNLLENACKFNLPAGLVRCELQIRGSLVRLSVANTGHGIPPEMQPRLFQRFFRADTARATAGHGLGLSLCREIVQAHGGHIGLNQEARDGLTEFVATFPLPPIGAA